jgi:1-acyl-sn-glycerol-3-phosphate acyltransferase
VSADQPLVVFLNHAGWWDPLVCMLLREAFFPQRRCHAPIDAAMLGRYRFFERLGFFGVEQHSSRGAVRFLQTAGAILAAPNTALWLTPQGRFGDVRERPVRFKSGIGHLAARVPDALFLPLAVEFVHWEERTPEALIRFGEPVGMPPEDDRSPGAWTERLEHALETTQDALAADSQSRDPARFRPLDRGTAGVGGVYDRWRRMQAWLQGREFDSRHGSR